jgi:rod shape-determining protein MreD
MKNKLRTLYVLLIVAILIQTQFALFSMWIPDLILLLVVFTGIFFKKSESLVFAAIAGVLRGLFSVDLLSVDMVVFPVTAMISNAISRSFYRLSPFVHLTIAVIAVFVVKLFHVLFYKSMPGTAVEILPFFWGGRRSIITTILFAPILFSFLEKALKMED